MFEVSTIGAMMAGLLSFLSPCILPIVPFYLSYMAGSGIAQLANGEHVDPGIQRRAIVNATFFSAGVITIFMGFGATATAFGQLFREWIDILRWIAAALIFVMGLHFLGVLRIGLLYRQFGADTSQIGGASLLGAYTIGLAFAFGWTPCVGPVLAAILFTAAGSETMAEGTYLLLAYGIGMTFPFIFAAIFIVPFLRWMQNFRRHLGLVEKLTGAFLVAFAILIGTGQINLIAEWMLSIAPDIGVLM